MPAKTAKRSRTATHSPSSSNTMSLLSRVLPPSPPPTIAQPQIVFTLPTPHHAPSRRPSIFMISSPVGEEEDVDMVEKWNDMMWKSGKFLEDCLDCSFCHKTLKGCENQKDIFMYSRKPFCSEECREHQMEVDRLMRLKKAASYRSSSQSPVNLQT